MIDALKEDAFFHKLKDDTLNQKRSNKFGVYFPVTIDDSIVDWKFRLIRGVIFKEKVQVNETDLQCGLKFLDCEFTKGIKFNNVKSTDYSRKYDASNVNLEFIGCKSLFVAFDNNCEFTRGVKFEGCQGIEVLIISRTRIGNGGLTIKKCDIKKTFDIISTKTDVLILESIFNKPIKLASSFGTISFIKTQFKDYVKIWNCEYTNITLNHNNFQSTFDIQACRIKGLFIHGDSFNRKVRHENRDMSGQEIKANLDEVYITEANFIEGFEANGLGKSIKKITLPITPNFKGVIRFVGWKVEETKISGINQNLKLLFKQVSFKHLNIIDFNNFNNLGFDKCSGFSESSLILADCDLGLTKFNDFTFNSFGVIRANNVTLNKIVASSVDWFDDHKLKIEISNATETTNQRGRREIYRQIKQSLRSNGNQIDSLIFQAREMNAYRNELKASNNYGCADRLIMSVSRSNNYGINWGKPTLIIIGITICYYILVVPVFSEKLLYSFSPSIEDLMETLCEFWSRKEVLAQLFNPTRRFSLVYGNVDNDGLYFLDFLHRIVLSIFIFQIIIAFRKFVSK